MIHFFPSHTLKDLGQILSTMKPAIVIDTRGSKWNVHPNRNSVIKVVERHDAIYKEANILSELHDPTQSREAAIKNLASMGEDQDVVVIGGTGRLRQNHLAYYVAHELYSMGIETFFYASTLEAKGKYPSYHDRTAFSYVMDHIPYGGCFEDFDTIDLKRHSGQYYNNLFNTMYKVRVGKHHILRDFMFCAESDLMGTPNIPDFPHQVIESAQAICSKILEPVYEEFGPYALTYGYENRRNMESTYSADQKKKRTSSTPHHWDRGTFGKQIYARIDIMPYCVSDGTVTRQEFGKWLMYNTDVDLVMQWRKSDVYCITISPKPRRVWLEWVPQGRGDNGSNKKTYMGERFWATEFNKLAPEDRPKFYPSESGGKMFWGDK